MTTLLNTTQSAILLLSALLLTGCQLATSPDTPSPSAVAAVDIPPPVAIAPAEPIEQEPAHSSKYDGDSARLQQCQGQLEALKLMNPLQYKRLRKHFDYLMSGAAQYADMRSKTNADTQDTVDALYRYRASLICARIAQTLLDSLTSRGEARP